MNCVLHILNLILFGGLFELIMEQASASEVYSIKLKRLNLKHGKIVSQLNSQSHILYTSSWTLEKTFNNMQLRKFPQVHFQALSPFLFSFFYQFLSEACCIRWFFSPHQFLQIRRSCFTHWHIFSYTSQCLIHSRYSFLLGKTENNVTAACILFLVHMVTHLMLRFP